MILSIRKRALIAALIASMLFGMFAFTPHVKAQTLDPEISAMMVQIQQLMVILTSLQERLAAMQTSGSGSGLEGGFTARSISVSDNVQTTDTLKIRVGAGLNHDWVNSVPAHTKGKVISGPKYSNGYTWWFIQYENAAQGWSVENWLKRTDSYVSLPSKEDNEEESEPDSDIEISLVSTDASITATSPNLGDWGRFKIKFKVEAGEEDIRIRNSMYGSHEGALQKQDRPNFSVMKDGRVLTSGFSGNFKSMQPGFLSSAEYEHAVVSEKNDNYYVIEAGETETFTVDVTFTVVNSGSYKLLLEAPLTVLDENGNEQKVYFNEKRFITPSINLSTTYDDSDQGLDDSDPIIDPSVPVISNSALIRVANPPIVQLVNNKRYTFKPWETVLFRWDNSFSFNDTAQCLVVLKYGISSLKESYENSAAARDHIGFYAPVTSEFGELNKISVDCDSSNDSFDVDVYVDTDGPSGEGEFSAISKGNDYPDIGKKITYNNALARCFEFSSRYQSDTSCVWDGILIADIKTYGDGVQKLTAFFNGFNEFQGVSAVNADRAIVIGAYEGTYPDGVSHSYGNHPEGEVDVYLPDGGSHTNMLLVLTSYEPVEWNLTGPGTDNVAGVLATGYYDQRVDGLSSDVPVKTLSHESGDDEYFYAYQNSGSNYNNLSNYISEHYGVNITQFFGNYSQDDVSISGYKG